MSKTNKIFFAVNVIMFLVIAAFMSAFLPSCSSNGGTGSGTGGGKTYQASDILFRPANAQDNSQTSARNQSGQTIYADQVILDNQLTSLSSGNVQAAFEEAEPDLAQILIGTWDTKLYTISDAHPAGEVLAGYIKFNVNGTFECDENGGKFATYYWGFDDRETFSPISYEVLQDNILKITYHYIEGDGDEWDLSNHIVFSTIRSNKLIHQLFGNSPLISEKRTEE